MPNGTHRLVSALAVLVSLASCGGQAADPALTQLARGTGGTITLSDASGALISASSTGQFDVANPFFHTLGGDGRACVTCHQPAAGWSLTPALAQARFGATQGRDPLFDVSDAATSPQADVSNATARRTAFGLLLNKGLIRIQEPVPASAEFRVQAIDDPYHYATSAQLSLYRRPLPSTNLSGAVDVTWDGRDDQPGGQLQPALAAQAREAASEHAHVTSLPDATVDQIVRFESSLTTSQSSDAGAGQLPALATGAFAQFGAWLGQPAGSPQQQIAQGEAIFERRTFTMADVDGFPGTRGHVPVNTSCRGCHSSPSTGASVASSFMNIGVADAPLRTPDLPLYTLQDPATGETIRTTDPGRALVTGKWDDVGKFKVPSLRGLAARPPYFHNSSAATLLDIVHFYKAHSDLTLAPAEEADLVAYLRAL
ncbi:MAG: hypothetical protein JO247_06895 [Chloroflexi bacterium]|nr:hypothetical protein [Chloroflexota bacterium]